MYIPHYYKNENIGEVFDFVKSNSFGILIQYINGRPHGTHIPLMMEQSVNGDYILLGHVGKVNPAAEALQNGEEVMCIFNGPHTYISSSLYDHDNVSTWNYVSVHVYGSITILDNDRLVGHLRSLVNHYEKPMPNPKMYEDLGPDALRQIKGIVGFEIKISDVQAAYKLSQNRNDKDYKAITDHLDTTQNPADTALSDIMKKRR